MGSLLSYSGVVTKIRAMEKHLISDGGISYEKSPLR